MKKVKFESSPLLQEIKVTYKTKLRACERPQIRESSDIVAYLREIWEPDTIESHETFYVVLLDRSSRVMGWNKAGQGGIEGVSVDTRVILSCALKCRACSIILAHNHPSGNAKPSKADRVLTEDIRKAGKTMNIDVFDHIILTKDEHTSFADVGYL